MKNEVLPKNILMIGPTGVGKTEISRRLSKLAEAPFVKVEATRFTEVGYVGRDVEQIVRDLVEIAISMEKVKKRKEVYAQAQKLAEEKVLDALVGKKASLATRESFRKRLRNGDLDNNEIEIEVQGTAAGLQSFEIPGMPGGNVGMVNLGDILGKSMGNKKGKKKKMTVKESHDILVAQESDKMIEEDKIIKELGGQMWKVSRGTDPEWFADYVEEDITPKHAHPSEWKWAKINFDWHVKNNSTVSKLYQQVDKMISPFSDDMDPYIPEEEEFGYWGT